MMKENTKTYIAPNFNMALKKVKAELGPDAMILSHETVNGQAHVVAALETALKAQLPKHELGNSLFEKTLVKTQQNRYKNVGNEFSSVLMATANENKPIGNKKKSSASQKISEDIEYIKSVLQNNVLKIYTLAQNENDAYLRKLRRKLRTRGFNREVVDKVLYGASECQSFEKLCQLMVENFVHLIRCNKMDFCSQRKVKAFIGPSGGGKTSFMSKLIIYLLENKINANIALIFVNHSNIKVFEESKILGRVFNIPSYYVENAKELETAYHQSHDKSNVLIEFPSIDLNNSENNFFFEFMYKFANDIDNTLVLPSILSSASIEKIIAAYSHIKFDGIALTKWDENQSCEEILNASIHHQIPLRFISEGLHAQSLVLATTEYFIAHLKNNYIFPKIQKHHDLVSFEINEVKL